MVPRHLAEEEPSSPPHAGWYIDPTHARSGDWSPVFWSEPTSAHHQRLVAGLLVGADEGVAHITSRACGTDGGVEVLLGCLPTRLQKAAPVGPCGRFAILGAANSPALTCRHTSLPFSMSARSELPKTFQKQGTPSAAAPTIHDSACSSGIEPVSATAEGWL